MNTFSMDRLHNIRCARCKGKLQGKYSTPPPPDTVIIRYFRDKKAGLGWRIVNIKRTNKKRLFVIWDEIFKTEEDAVAFAKKKGWKIEHNQINVEVAAESSYILYKQMYVRERSLPYFIYNNKNNKRMGAYKTAAEAKQALDSLARK